ncbi:MAG: hypothetical protein M3S32_09905 [Acidobacteriota bacterium]|nr:hypothetical protein [Acidobacteriota bacterium]
MNRENSGTARASRRIMKSIQPFRVSRLLRAIFCLAASAGAMALAAGLNVSLAGPGAGGATKLALAPSLSFTDDSSSNFPIRGENITDGRIATDRPTAIFFGTSHCWNTNREAERFVRLYEAKKESVRFLVVDLNKPSPDQKALVSRFYSGYIPTLAFLDREGRVVYNKSGETARERGDTSGLEELLKKAMQGS